MENGHFETALTSPSGSTIGSTTVNFMPYVVKHASGRSPYWIAVYRDETGRRRKRSTKLTSKSKALEVAHTLARAAAEARRGSLTEARTRDLLGEILQSVNGEGLRTFTVAQWFDHFVRQKQKSRADKTALRHEQMMNEFVAFLGYRANLNLAVVNAKDVADFREHRESLGLAPSTINGDITILSSAFNAALRQGHISVNPCLAIEPVKDRGCSAERNIHARTSDGARASCRQR
jgi:Phage integrase SAM-like domain